MYFIGDDGFQNIFIYQPTNNRLEIKYSADLRYANGWLSKELSYNSKFVLVNRLSSTDRRTF